MRGRGRGPDELEHQVVGVAVEPVLAGLVRPDDGVSRRPEMSGGVPAGRLVAAAHVPTHLAKAQVDPVLRAGRQTVLAAPRTGLGILDLVQVHTFVGHWSPSLHRPFYPPREGYL